MDKISEHVIEIRFKPDSYFLDKRGQIASSIGASTALDQWSISNVQIDFSSKSNEKIQAFYSYKNIGFTSYAPNDSKFFQEEAGKFIKAAWAFIGQNEITRIGIRSKFITETESFTSAFNAYKKKFLALSDDDLKKFGGSLVDLGFPMNFIDGENYFNIVNMGPMEKSQFAQQLTVAGEAFDAGIFLDIDYFKKEFSPHTNQRNVIDFLRQGIKKSEQLYATLNEWVNPEHGK